VPVADERNRTLVSAAPPGEGRGSNSTAPELRVGTGVIRLVFGNIVEAGTEAIVNSTDPELSGIGVLDSTIHAAAGPELREALRRRGRCPIGRAVITGAGRIPHPTRFILHAVGPVYRQERERECAALLRSAYLESLALAEKNNVHSVAFPAISTGTHGYPMRKAARVALDAAADHLADPARSVKLIMFVLFGHAGLTTFAGALASKART
jgi:serine/threonine-protein kinase